MFFGKVNPCVACAPTAWRGRCVSGFCLSLSSKDSEKKKGCFCAVVWVQIPKSSPLINVVFRTREVKKKQPASQVLKTIFHSCLSLQIRAKYFCFPTTLGSEGQARASCPEDFRAGKDCVWASPVARRLDQQHLGRC